MLLRVLTTSMVLLGAGWASAAPAPTRTVIVFDNSGSMKQNDPGRLSEAAARLYFQLARPGDEVGLVAFDEHARVVLPLGHRASKEELSKALASLRFTGPTTDIGAALEAAQEALGAQTPAGRRDLVLLLTDGQVDLGPARAEQVPAEVRRIAGPLARAFQERGAPVYAIAFTADSDRALLEKLAVKSGGLFRYIQDPNALHRAFTEMFMLAGDVESLPIEDGEVTFDESIGTAQMVLSKNHPGDQNKLVAPDEGEVSADHPREGVEWTSAPSHDVVRLTHPEPGQWNIDQPEGVHGAVAIVGESDLQFVVRSGPSPATVLDPVRFEAELTEHGERVVAFARLKDVEVSAQIKDPEGHERTLHFTRAEKDHGLFEAEAENEAPGEYSAMVSIKGPHIERQRRVAYRVLPPCFTAVLEPKELRIEVQAAELCPRYSGLSARLIRKVKGSKSTEFELLADPEGGFSGTVPPLEPDEVGAVVVEIKGRTSDGYPVQYRLPKLMLPTPPKAQLASLVGRGLLYADGPVCFLVAIGLMVLLRRRQRLLSVLSEEDHHPPPPPSPTAEAKAEAPSEPVTQVVLLSPEDAEMLEPVGVGGEDAINKLKKELQEAREELVRLGQSTKAFEESVETLLLKQAEVATSVGGLGGSEGLPPEVKARADVVLAGMRAMDDLLIQGSDRGVELDKGLRDLEAKLGLLVDGQGVDWTPRRPAPAEINAILLAKASKQSAEELAKLREEAQAAREARKAGGGGDRAAVLETKLSEQFVAFESLSKEHSALAVEKEEMASKLAKITDEYDRLFTATEEAKSAVGPAEEPSVPS